MNQIDRLNGLVGTLGVKAPVRLGTTGSITLNGPQIIDSVAAEIGDRVLVKNQTDTTQNGIYYVENGDWTRAPDFDGAHDVLKGTEILITEGTANHGTAWEVLTSDPMPGSAMSFLRVTIPSNFPTIMDFGAAGDGVTDDTIPLTAAFNAINAGTTRVVYFPAGTYKFNTQLPTITADNWALIGEGHGVSRLLIDSAAGALSNFFTIGSATQISENWNISGLWLENANFTTMGTTNPFNIVNAVNGRIADMFGRFVCGFVTMGGATTLAQRIRLTGWEMRVYGPAGGTVIDVRYQQVCTFSDGLVAEVHNSGAGGMKSIHIHPSSPAAVVDSCRWTDLEFNYPNTDVDQILVIDATSGIVVNQFFSDCVFDHGALSCIDIGIGALSNGSARINNIFFGNVRSQARNAGAGPVLLHDETGGGGRRLQNIQFNGGVLITETLPCVRILNADQDVHASFIGMAFQDSENVTPKAAIEADLGNIRVVGCIAQSNNEATPCTFDYGVKFTDAGADTFAIVGNDFSACTIGDVNIDALAANNAAAKVISGNIAVRNAPGFKKQTTNATLTTIGLQLLADATTYHAKARVVGVKSDGTARASYELSCTCYRTAAGAAVIEGDVTVIHQQESDATWAANLAVSGNELRVNVQGVAATTINWTGTLELLTTAEA